MSALASGRGSRALAGRRLAAPAAFVVTASALAIWLAADAGVAGPSAVPSALRAGCAAVGLFGACGYVPARLLLPEDLKPYLALFVLPLGAACASFGLAVLGFLHVPLDISAFALPAAFAILGVWLRWARGPARASAESLRRAGSVAQRLLLPGFVALLVGAIALIPMFRSGYATVIGQNGDAELAVSVAEFLEQAPPRAERPKLVIDHMPWVWRSKYPIYYSLAGVSRLSGLQPYQVLATQMAVLFGLVSISFFLFARRFLGASPAAALAAMAAVPLDRIVVYLGIHPFHNQIWGLLLLPLVLVLGLEYLRAPERGTLIAFLLVAALGAFAWPLMLPVPLLVLGVAAWTLAASRRAEGRPAGWVAGLRLPRTRRSLLLWIPAGLLALPALVVGVVGASEKIVSAAKLFRPGSSLYGWRGADGFLPFPRFFGIPGHSPLAYAGAFAVIAVAALALRGRPREVVRSLVAFGVLALAVGVYFRARRYGDLINFKDLSFFGPFAVALAMVGLVETIRVRAGALRPVAGVALAAFAVALVAGARQEIAATYEQLTRDMLGLRDFSHRLPRQASIRIDLEPGGYQLWARHMLYQHPLSASRPLVGTLFPHPPLGRKADFILTSSRARRPRDAAGAPVLANRSYAIYRMRSSVPGPDVSSITLVDDAAVASE